MDHYHQPTQRDVYFAMQTRHFTWSWAFHALHSPMNTTGLFAVKTSTYLHGPWQFCTELGFCIQDHLPNLPLLCEHDQFLMAAFIEYGYLAGQLRILNLCQITWRIVYLSDLALAMDATSLLKTSLHAFRATPTVNITGPGPFCQTGMRGTSGKMHYAFAS